MQIMFELILNCQCRQIVEIIMRMVEWVRSIAKPYPYRIQNVTYPLYTLRVSIPVYNVYGYSLYALYSRKK